MKAKGERIHPAATRFNQDLQGSWSEATVHLLLQGKVIEVVGSRSLYIMMKDLSLKNGLPRQYGMLFDINFKEGTVTSAHKLS